MASSTDQHDDTFRRGYIRRRTTESGDFIITETANNEYKIERMNKRLLIVYYVFNSSISLVLQYL